jgi:hypothetical protein
MQDNEYRRVTRFRQSGDDPPQRVKSTSRSRYHHDRNYSARPSQHPS